MPTPEAVSYALISEGSSDRALLELINWCLRDRDIGVERGDWVDFRELKAPPSSLLEQARTSLELFPSDLLFVHRDAEDLGYDERLRVLERDLAALEGRFVPVIPVRMLEAWLLFDEEAIRFASGNPNGKAALNLPKLSRVEADKDPKETLRAALEAASAPGSRRQRARTQRRFGQRRQDVARSIEDFRPLRELPAFLAFEAALDVALGALGEPG